ncbi:DUF2162 domain-containing protein [bacterium]|nr:DUF2162 domain-containing protein [bacterium]
MDLSIILWIGGMLFTLSIFAVKVGFGLGFGGLRKKGIVLILLCYLAAFVLIATFSGRLFQLFEPVLRKGPYLHMLMATGLMIWGIYLLHNTKHKHCSKYSAIFLWIPCPVCVAAITFSTWAALNVIKLPAPVVGLCIGTSFVVLTLLIIIMIRMNCISNSNVNIGLSMIGIGLYFLATLVLPPKIEEAKGIYGSFLTGTNNIDLNNSIGVFALLFSAMLIGFFAKRTQGGIKQ